MIKPMDIPVNISLDLTIWIAVYVVFMLANHHIAESLKVSGRSSGDDDTYPVHR